MKNIFFAIIPGILISLLLCSSFGQETAKDSFVVDKKKNIEMRGFVKRTRSAAKEIENPLDSALIRVFNEKNTEVLHLLSNKKGKCNFKLPLFRQFTILISKPGYVPKIIAIDTEVPMGKENNYTFFFDVDIFEDIKGLDVSVLKKPIAKIVYSTGNNRFLYDVQYTTKINMDLKKMYKNYYFLQSIEADTVTVSGKTGKQMRQKRD